MEDLKAQFEAFAGFGTRQATSEIDGAKFAKLCRECKLLGKTFTATDCDLIFSKVKPKGARKIGFTGSMYGDGAFAQYCRDSHRWQNATAHRRCGGGNLVLGGVRRAETPPLIISVVHRFATIGRIRKMQWLYAEYQAALKLVADKKGIEYDALVSKILAAGGPGSSGTKADDVKFHDDKSLYTGVYKNGGPTNVDNGTADLSNITDRSAADVRGVKT